MTIAYRLIAVILASSALISQAVASSPDYPSPVAAPRRGLSAAPATPTPPAASAIKLTDVISSTTNEALSELFIQKARFTFKGAGKSQPTGIEIDNPFLTLFPELRRAAAPSWLKAGARVTYRVESATLVQDPDDTGSTGAGYAQYDLVALDNAIAISSMKLYIDTGQGTVIPSTIAPSAGVPGAGDFWLNPKALQNAEKIATQEMIVVRMPLKIDGKSYKTVRFQYQKDDTTYVWMYDETSGLLLFYRHDIGGENAARRQLSSMTFTQRRQVKIPWTAGSVPTWLKANGQLKYDGTYRVIIAGSPVTPLAYATVAKIKKVGTSWAQYSLTGSLSGRADLPADRVTGAAQIFDGLWLAPEAIEALAEDGTLDSDPVTGAEIGVSHARGGLTILTETGDTYRISLAYDEAGVLVGIQREENNGIATIQIELDLTSRR